MSYSTTLSREERNTLALSLLEHVVPLLRQSARDGKFDYDELYQDAFLKIVRILDERLGQVGSLPAYVAASVRNMIVDQVRYCKIRRAVSLDEPLLDDVSFTLADVLPSGYSVEPVTVVLIQEHLQELQPMLSEPMHPGTRRMLREMYATALAVHC